MKDAERALWSIDLRGCPARLLATAELLRADIAVRYLRAEEARSALGRARRMAGLAQITSLKAEVVRREIELEAPVARLIDGDGERLITLLDVEALGGSGNLVIDACRREVRTASKVVSLATRPVLFALCMTLGQSAPAEATRETLIRAAFGNQRVSDSLRARLRVEIGRVRRAVATFADVRATSRGFVIAAHNGVPPVVLHPPQTGETSALLALLSGGESWSTSGLAAAVASSQRTVQRALQALMTDGKVTSVGRGRSRRWVAPPPAGFASTLSLIVRTKA